MSPFTILEVQLSVVTENIANAFWWNYNIEVKKDEDYYRLNIIIDSEEIWSISINWKWLDETEYYQELLDLLYKYLTTKI